MPARDVDLATLTIEEIESLYWHGRLVFGKNGRAGANRYPNDHRYWLNQARQCHRFAIPAGELGPM